MKMRLLMLVMLLQTTSLLNAGCWQRLKECFGYAKPDPNVEMANTPAVAMQITTQELQQPLLLPEIKEQPKKPKLYKSSGCENKFFRADSLENLEFVLNHVYELIVQDHRANKSDKPSVAIFDVDKTSLFLSLTYDGGILRTPFKPIKAIHRFYSKLIRLGIVIIFLTTRPDNTLEACNGDLIDCGYLLFQQIIMMPAQKYIQFAEEFAKTGYAKHFEFARGIWKAKQRNIIAQKYTILTTLDDHVLCLGWGTVGRAVNVDLQIPDVWTVENSNHPLLAQA